MWGDSVTGTERTARVREREFRDREPAPPYTSYLLLVSNVLLVGGVSALRCAAATKIFAAEFTDAAAELQRRIALHVRAAREIMSSRALLRLLKEVLLIGNMMNASEEVG